MDTDKYQVPECELKLQGGISDSKERQFAMVTSSDGSPDIEPTSQKKKKIHRNCEDDFSPSEHTSHKLPINKSEQRRQDHTAFVFLLAFLKKNKTEALCHGTN